MEGNLNVYCGGPTHRKKVKITKDEYIQTILLFDFPFIYYIDYNIKIKVDEYVKLKPSKMNL